MTRDLPPQRPVLAVLAIVLRGEDVLLVKRKNDPDAGTWGFPGGRLDYGESLQDGACRELFEETGVIATAGDVIATQEVIVPATNAALPPVFHYVLMGLSCSYLRGDPVAGDDAEEAEFAMIEDVLSGVYVMSEGVTNMLRLALAERDKAKRHSL